MNQHEPAMEYKMCNHYTPNVNILCVGVNRCNCTPQPGLPGSICTFNLLISLKSAVTLKFDYLMKDKMKR